MHRDLVIVIIYNNQSIVLIVLFNALITEIVS